MDTQTVLWHVEELEHRVKQLEKDIRSFFFWRRVRVIVAGAAGGVVGTLLTRWLLG